MSSRAHRCGRTAQLPSRGVFGAHRRTGESVGGQWWAVWAWVRTGWAEGTRGARWGGAPEATLPGGHLPQVEHPLRGRTCGCRRFRGVGGAPRHQPPANKRERLRRTKCAPRNDHRGRCSATASPHQPASGALYALRAMTTADGGWLPQPVVGGNTNVDVGTDLVLRSLRLRLYVWLLGD